ncbi:MAG: sugar-binding protein [Eubacteriales bacterium]|nr:sugar-binding protein [Eubacteriales bacterium]
MKRTTKLLITVVMAVFISALPMTVFALTPIGNINVPFGTPTIDGNLAQGEWSENNKIVVDQNTATADGWTGEVPADLKIDFYYTWDNDNLYLAGIITDPTFMYSASGDNYNGDAFQISLNLGQVFKSAEYDRAIFYSWGCLEDGTVDVFRQESMDNIVLEDVGFSKKLDTGWQFEIALPWTVLVEDVSAKSGVDVTVAAGLKIDALICYLDRDEDGTLLNGFFTSNTEPGGWDPDVFGITLNLVAKPEAAPETEAEADAGSADTAAEAPAAQAPAAQTADASPVAAALLILAAGAVIAVWKKKR